MTVGVGDALDLLDWKRQVSAEGDGLLTCTIVGEPTVWFVRYDNYPGGFCRAGVNMTCS